MVCGEKRILINKLYILPEHQNRGVGTHLIRGVLQHAKREQPPVRLGVLRVNKAQRLYRRLGFLAVDQTETHIKMEWTP